MRTFSAGRLTPDRGWIPRAAMPFLLNSRARVAPPRTERAVNRERRDGLMSCRSLSARWVRVNLKPRSGWVVAREPQVRRALVSENEVRFFDRVTRTLRGSVVTCPPIEEER